MDNNKTTSLASIAASSTSLGTLADAVKTQAIRPLPLNAGATTVTNPIVPTPAPSPSADMASMQAELARLQKENEEMKAKSKAQADRKLSMKVAEKSGGLSVYGLGRFPVTLFKSQWRKLIAAIGEVEAFIVENDDKLADKV